MGDNLWDEQDFFQLQRQKKIKRLLGVSGIILVLILIDTVVAILMNADRAQDKISSSVQVLNNSFAERAEQIGVKNCAALFSTLGETLTVNSQYSAQIIWHQKEADHHAVQALVGQAYHAGNKTSKGAGVIFTAPIDSGCEGMMVRTVLMPQACTDIVKNQLPEGAERQSDLTETAMFRLPDRGYVMMIPASANSCVVVTALDLTDRQ